MGKTLCQYVTYIMKVSFSGLIEKMQWFSKSSSVQASQTTTSSKKDLQTIFKWLGLLCAVLVFKTRKCWNNVHHSKEREK